MSNVFPWRYTVMYDPPAYGYPYNTNSWIKARTTYLLRMLWCGLNGWRYPCGVVIIDNR